MCKVSDKSDKFVLNYSNLFWDRLFFFPDTVYVHILLKGLVRFMRLVCIYDQRGVQFYLSEIQMTVIFNSRQTDSLTLVASVVDNFL